MEEIGSLPGSGCRRAFQGGPHSGQRGVWLAEICKREGFRFSPRLHVDLYGNTRGTWRTLAPTATVLEKHPSRLPVGGLLLPIYWYVDVLFKWPRALGPLWLGAGAGWFTRRLHRRDHSRPQGHAGPDFRAIPAGSPL